MSVATRRAIYGKLAGDTTLTNLLGTAATGYTKSIYFRRAPKGANFPCVIFSKAAGTPEYSLASKAFDNEVWLVKGVDRNDDTDPVETISARLDALLTDGTISISGQTQRYLRRISDVEYDEVKDGLTYNHSGAEYRLVYT